MTTLSLQTDGLLQHPARRNGGAAATTIACGGG